MPSIKNAKILKPLLVAITLYSIIAIGYFGPQFSGEVLSQHDVKQYNGMTQDILENREATGEDPQWSGNMFGGMPAYLINVAYPAQIIKTTLGKLVNVIDTPAAFIFFAMLSMWLMLVMMGFNGWVAIVGGLMYGLSTYFFLIIGAGHITKMWALVYAPLMFGGTYIALRGNMWLGASLAALFASLQIGANHPQITYYFGMAMAAFWLSELWAAYKDKILKRFAQRTALLLAAAVLAVGSNFAPLWYTAEHTPDTIRGGSELSTKRSEGLDMDYATAWSYGRAESFNMLIPNFVGGTSMDTFSTDGAVAESLAPYQMEQVAQQLPAYWADQPFTGGPTYIGAVVIFMALLGFMMLGNRERWWIVAITVIMILLAWGRHFMWFTELMFNILPGYDKFRTVSMTLVVVEWTMPLLATYGLAKLWSGEISGEELKRKIIISTLSLGGLIFVLIGFSGVLFGFGYASGFEMLVGAGLPDDLAQSVARAMADEREWIMRQDALRSLLFAMGAALVVIGLLYKRYSAKVMLLLIGVLTVADLAMVNMRYLNYDSFKPARSERILPSEADKQIMADSDLGYRVLNLTVSPFNDATTSYFHRSVGGYHGAKLSRYQDIIDNYFSGSINPEILDMLNTRYIIQGDGKGGVGVTRRDSTNGAAWFVDMVHPVASARDEIDLLGQVDTRAVALVDTRFGEKAQPKGGGEISLVEYRPNYQRYDYTSDEGGVALFSEIYYDKGWSAYVDGREAPYFRANYILRAMELPAGAHTVEWRFKAPRWRLIEGITLACSIVIILSVMIFALVSLRKPKE